MSAVASLNAQGSVQRQIESFAEEGPTSAVASSPSQVKIEAGQANGQGEISLRFANGLGLKVGAPTDKNSNVTEFTNLDALANNLSVSGTWSWTGWGLTQLNDVVLIAKRQEQSCKNNKIPLAKCVSEGDVEKFLESERRPSREIRKAVLDFDRATFQDSWVWGTFIEGKLGQKKFDFFDSQAAEKEETEISSSISSSLVGIYGPGRISFGLSYQSAFEDAKTKARHCEDIGSSDLLQKCKELPLGPPSRMDSMIARTELRHIFGKWALSPLASWDFKKDVGALELPIYFLPDNKGLLTGGLKLGWRSDGKNLTGSIFLTKPIALF
jgi:hypothetical protein